VYIQSISVQLMNIASYFVICFYKVIYNIVCYGIIILNSLENNKYLKRYNYLFVGLLVMSATDRLG